MAQARFFEKETTDEHGEVSEYLEGEILTRRDKLIVRIERLVEKGALVNAERPSHRVKVRAHYGEYIEAGAAWTKKKDDLVYLSVSMNDPQLSFALFPAEDTGEEDQPDWEAGASSFRSAA